MANLNTLFRQMYGVKQKEDWTAEEWAQHDKVTPEDLSTYVNAVIGTSPLMQALSEDLVKRDLTKSKLEDLIPDGGKLLSMLRSSPSSFTGKTIKIGEK